MNTKTPTAQLGPSSTTHQNRLVIALVFIALLFLLILFPDHPQSFTLKHFLKLPIEWPVIVLALLLSKGITLTLLRYALVILLALSLLLRIADIGSRLAFDRRFSPLVEWHLLGDGWNLASQQVGLLEAGFFVLLAIIILTVLVFALFKGLGSIGRLTGITRMVLGIAAAIALLVGTLGIWQQEPEQKNPRIQARFLPELLDRSRAMQRSVVDQQSFVIDLEQDSIISTNPAPSFSALAGLDVGFVFIESYGQSFFLDKDFAPLAQGRLSNIENTLTNAGLHMRSGWITSPIRGGRSWLAHASFASGLKVTNQARFDRLVASNRVSLYSLFSNAGWQTAGLVPAIREAWPEGAWYGFNDIYDFEGMKYKGEPFGWVTMPDQYTLSTFEHAIRQSSDSPVMAEIALISSHAPWTPLPTLAPWDAIDDGSIFDGSYRFGEPMTWNNRIRVREMYAKSLDYSLTTVGEYLERHGKGALFVILGDHQPASIIAGWGKTADVPVHIVSDDAALLERLPADVFTQGMTPSLSSNSLPMWSVREMMSTVFEEQAH